MSSDIVIRTPKKHKTIIAPDEAAADAIGKLTPGFAITGVTKGQFSLLDLILAVSDQIGPCELIVSTWSTAIKDTQNLRVLIDKGRFTSVGLLLDATYASRHADYVQDVLLTYGRENIRQVPNHAKFFFMRNEKWNVVCRSSMNLNRNPRLEQFDIDDDPGLAEFFRSVWSEAQAMCQIGCTANMERAEDDFEAMFGGRIGKSTYKKQVSQDFAQDFDSFKF